MKTKKIKTVEVVKEIGNSFYNAKIKILGKFYESSGNTAMGAIENLKPEGKCAGTSILSITHNGITKEKVLPSFQTFRLFSPSKLTREIALKNLSLIFNT